MADSRTIDSYGGEFADALPVEDPTTEQSAAYANRLHEDTAHMTRSTRTVIVAFPTTSTAAPTTVTATAGRSHAGTSSGLFPTVSKTATGRYTLTFPSSFVDALGVTETLSLTFARGSVMHNTSFGHVQCTASANVVLVSIVDLAGSDTDLSGSKTIEVTAE